MNMHNTSVRKALGILGKILLFVIGYILVFKIYYFFRNDFSLHDAMGISGLWIRPYYRAVLNLAPYLYAPGYIRLIYSYMFWLKVVISIFVPILSVIGFEISTLRKSRLATVLFYIFVPAALYLLSSTLVFNFFPSDS